MSRRASPWPAAHPTIDVLAAQIPFLATRIARLGVSAQDAEDVLQEVLAGAVLAAREGRYQPDPRVDPRQMLRGWLASIVTHQVEHYRNRAHRRREQLCAVADRPHVATQATSAEAWDVLRALAALRPELREVIALEAQGWRVKEIAVHLAIPVGTAATRLRSARKRLARKGGR